MNVKQLELKRLNQALQAIRFARHMAQAMRKPLAQLLRLEHAANVRIKKANQAYSRLTDQDFSQELDFTAPMGLDLPTLVETVKSQATALADEDKRLVKRMARLQKEKSLASSSVELRKVRKRIEKAREKKEQTARQRRELGLLELIEKARTYASQMENSHPRARNAIANMIEDAEQDELSNWPMLRATLRHHGETEIADALEQADKEFRRNYEGA